MPVYAQTPSFRTPNFGRSIIEGFREGENLFQYKQRQEARLRRWEMEGKRLEAVEARSVERHRQQMELGAMRLESAEREEEEAVLRKTRVLKDLEPALEAWEGLGDEVGRYDLEGGDIGATREFLTRLVNRGEMLKAQQQHILADAEHGSALQGGMQAFFEKLSGVANALPAMEGNAYGKFLGEVSKLEALEDPVEFRQGLNRIRQVYHPLGMSGVYGERYKGEVERVEGRIEQLVQRNSPEVRKKMADAEMAERELEKPELTPGQKAMDTAFAADFGKFLQGGKASAEANISKLRDALEKLSPKDGKKREHNYSGPVVSLLPDRVRQEATALKQQVETVIQQSLKDILGGQFAQAEADQLFRRSYDDTLGEELNAAKVEATLGFLEEMYKAKTSMAEYFGKYGTLVGYEGGNPKSMIGRELDPDAEEPKGEPLAVGDREVEALLY